MKLHWIVLLMVVGSAIGLIMMFDSMHGNWVTSQAPERLGRLLIGLAVILTALISGVAMLARRQSK